MHQQVDRAAKKYILINASPPFTILPVDSAYLSTNEGAITNNEKYILKSRYSTYCIEHYYAFFNTLQQEYKTQTSHCDLFRLVKNWHMSFCPVCCLR